MAPPTMARVVPLLALLAIAVAPSPVAAQETPVVSLVLLSQTPWNSSYEEDGRDLVVRFSAENLGATALDELSIGVTLYPRVTSRSAFEQSLISDPPVSLAGETYAREGSLAPDERDEFEISFPLVSGGIDPDDSGVYPLKVDLRTATTPVAAIRTPVVFLVRPPQEPLRLSWTFVLHHPIEFGPDGVFTSTALEESLSAEGTLAEQIRAMRFLASRRTRPAVDVALSPLLLRQLVSMRDGYEVSSGGAVREVEAGRGGAALANDALADLEDIVAAPNVRVTALPFSVPQLPSLLAEGLNGDLIVQLERGGEVISEVLGTTPVPGILRPPGDAVDEATLRELSAAGVSTLVLGPSTVETEPHPLDFAGSPTATIGDDGAIRAIVADPAVAAMLESSDAVGDPVRTAQIVLGELASIWQEQPGLMRGIAFLASEEAPLPASFYVPFVRAVAGAPWLTPMHVDEFATTFEPRETSALTATFPSTFTSTYVDELRQARRRIDTYRSMLANDSDDPDRLETMLLFAESGQYLSGTGEGLAFIAGVHDAVSAVFRSVTVDTAEEITLTSRTGSGIPVTVRNGADVPLRVHVTLESPFLRTSPSTDLELRPREAETVTFRVNAISTGRFEADLHVLAPAGRIIARRELTIRSTVYNRIALVITIAAALVLLLLWARRFIQRRTS
jgi:hypothetical protein